MARSKYPCAGWGGGNRDRRFGKAEEGELDKLAGQMVQVAAIGHFQGKKFFVRGKPVYSDDFSVTRSIERFCGRGLHGVSRSATLSAGK